jgi:type II secretory pathway pseudopilin PulG
MQTASTIRRGNTDRLQGPVRGGEDGYILIAVMFMLAVFIIAMAVAVPVVRKSIQREQEYETFQRGKQYARAVKLYYKKFGRYPPNVDALVKTNDIRFLRKKYVDPTTGKEDWKPVQFGQNKTPTAMGFFGQPLAGSSPGLSTTGLNGSAGLNGGAGGSAGVFGSISSSLNQNGQSGTSLNGSATSGTGTDSSNSGAGTSGGTDANGNPTAGAGTTTGSGATNSSGLTSTGPTIGGAGIIGFSPNSPKQSIHVYKKKNHYNEWEFTWDPASDMQMAQGGNAGTIGQPAGSANPTNNNGFGSTSTGSSFGNSGSTNSGTGSGSGSSSGSGNGSTTNQTQQ